MIKLQCESCEHQFRDNEAIIYSQKLGQRILKCPNCSAHLKYQTLSLKPYWISGIFFGIPIANLIFREEITRFFIGLSGDTVNWIMYSGGAIFIISVSYIFLALRKAEPLKLDMVTEDEM
jgi:hypothetical protein